MVETNYRTALTFQIDPTPDLQISKRYVSVKERPSEPDPIGFSVLVSNIGPVDSISFTISVYHTPLEGGTTTLVLQEQIDQPIATGERIWFEGATKVPRGNCLLRFEVHEVNPFENYRYNNVVEVQTFISSNNPPKIEVRSPINGTTWNDRLVVLGSTWDFDGDTNLTTSIWGLEDSSWTAHIIGKWNLTLELDDIPSGYYMVRFRASDGWDDSETLTRGIIIDHVDDSLILEDYTPEDDVAFLTGQTGTFIMNVSERFSRSISFSWSVDFFPTGSDRPVFRFIALKTGSFIVDVIVTNGLTSLHHRWNVTVSDPTPPRITGSSPESPILSTREAIINLSLTVENPDDVVTSVVWFLDSSAISNNDEAICTLNFPEPGVHSVKAVLISAVGSDEVHWIIDITNDPPKIVNRSPNTPLIETLGPISLDFAVEVMDTDDASVTYTWSSINVTIETRNANGTTVEFTDAGTYTISLLVDDGWDSTQVQWTVVIADKESPVSEPEWNLVPWIVLLLLLTAVVVAYVVRRSRPTRR